MPGPPKQGRSRPTRAPPSSIDSIMAAKQGTTYVVLEETAALVHQRHEVAALPSHLAVIPRKQTASLVSQTNGNTQEGGHNTSGDATPGAASTESTSITTGIADTARVGPDNDANTAAEPASQKTVSTSEEGKPVIDTATSGADSSSASDPSPTSASVPKSIPDLFADATQYEIHEELYTAIKQLVQPTLQPEYHRTVGPLSNAIVLGVDSEKALGLSDAVVIQIAKDLGTALFSCHPEDLEDLAALCHSQQAFEEADMRARLIAEKRSEEARAAQSPDSSVPTWTKLTATTNTTESPEQATIASANVTTSADKAKTTSTPEGTASSSASLCSAAAGTTDGASTDVTTSGKITPLSTSTDDGTAYSIVTEPNRNTEAIVKDAPTVITTGTASDAIDGNGEPQASESPVPTAPQHDPEQLQLDSDLSAAKTLDVLRLQALEVIQQAAHLDHVQGKLESALDGKKGEITEQESAAEGDLEPLEDHALSSNIPPALVEHVTQQLRETLGPNYTLPVSAVTAGSKGIPTDLHRPTRRRVDLSAMGLDDWCHIYDELELQSPYALTARYLGKGQLEDMFSRPCFDGHHSRKLSLKRELVRSRGTATWKNLLAEHATGFDITSNVEDLPAVIMHVRFANLLLDEVLHGDIFQRLNKIITVLRVVFHRKIILLISLIQSRTQKKDPFALCSDPDCEACTQDDMPRMMRAFYSRRGVDGPSCRSEKVPRALAKALDLTPASYIAVRPAGKLPEVPLQYTNAGLNLRRLCRTIRSGLAPVPPALPMPDMAVSKEALAILADWDLHMIRQVGAQFIGSCMSSQDASLCSLNNFVIDSHRQLTDAATKKDGTSQPLTDKAAKFSAEFEKKLAKVRKTCDEAERRVLDSIVKPNTNNTTYEDVILDDDTKTAVKQLISLYKVKTTCTSEKLLKMLNINGAMFYGPAGVGKTHLCRAMANDQKACMLAVDPAIVRSKWVGGNEKLAKAAFSVAKKMSPCILFIDEADSLFGKRSADDRTHERASLDIFLQQMDGIKTDKKGPFVVAATNRPADLDEAFLRRLPHKVLFKLPTEQQRVRILTLFLGAEDIDKTVDVHNLAKQTAGFSGSDLKTLCGQAVLAWATEKDIGDNLGEDEMQIKLSATHFKAALKRTHATVSRHAVKELEDWQNSAMGTEPLEHQTMYS